jgi:hypothetical protein
MKVTTPILGAQVVAGASLKWKVRSDDIILGGGGVRPRLENMSIDGGK